jgi:hypothetical protein
MLFAPASRAALNATPAAAHGRTSAVLSLGRLLGAAAGAELAGVALSRGTSLGAVHQGLLLGCAACIIFGLPAATRLGARPTKEDPPSGADPTAVQELASVR